jgi:hypothetical protein
MRQPMGSSAGAAGAKLAAAAALLICGCAAAPKPPLRLPGEAAPLQRDAPAAVPGSPRATGSAPAPALGTPQRIGAGTARLVVSAERIIDPLHGAGGAVPAGSRAIGLVVRVLDVAGGAYDGSATTDFGLIANGPVSPLYLRSGACRTPVEGLEAEIAPGQARSGCVAFSLPSGAHITAVRFAAGGSSRRLLWRAGA